MLSLAQLRRPRLAKNFRGRFSRGHLSDDFGGIHIAISRFYFAPTSAQRGKDSYLLRYSKNRVHHALRHLCANILFQQWSLVRLPSAPNRFARKSRASVRERR